VASAKKKASPAAAKKKPAAKRKSTPPPPPKPKLKRPAGPVFRSLRTVIYKVDDLQRARTFYSAALGRAPYFDQPFYVGFDVDGQELGLDPDVSTVRPGRGGAAAYWRVDSIADSWQHLLALGASAIEPPHDVGGDIQVALVGDPFGNLVGLIQLDS
jgi:predicted enzyme related to lactoylglutathione lyase